MTKLFTHLPMCVEGGDGFVYFAERARLLDLVLLCDFSLSFVCAICVGGVQILL